MLQRVFLCRCSLERSSGGGGAVTWLPVSHSFCTTVLYGLLCSTHRLHTHLGMFLYSIVSIYPYDQKLILYKLTLKPEVSLACNYHAITQLQSMLGRQDTQVKNSTTKLAPINTFNTWQCLDWLHRVGTSRLCNKEGQYKHFSLVMTDYPANWCQV